MKITLLGVEGCPTCTSLDCNVQAALLDINANVVVEKITDPEQIMSFEAGGLPAVLIDGKIKAVRRVPTIEELKGWLENA